MLCRSVENPDLVVQETEEVHGQTHSRPAGKFAHEYLQGQKSHLSAG